MSVIINLDAMLERRKMGITELADKIGMSPASLSTLQKNKAEAIRFSTLDLICKALQCEPGDILIFADEESLNKNELVKTAGF